MGGQVEKAEFFYAFFTGAVILEQHDAKTEDSSSSIVSEELSDVLLQLYHAGNLLYDSLIFLHAEMDTCCFEC